jgi:hypothetical protein
MVMMTKTTFDILDKYDEAEEQKRLIVLAEQEVNDLGRSYQAQKELLGMVELRCQIRAHRLEQMGQDVKDIARLFGVEPKVVRKWLKGFTPSVVI